MKVGQIGPTFIFPVKTVTFYWVESLVTSSILKMRKSHKKLAPVYAYPHAYTQICDRGGWLGPPPPWIGVKTRSSSDSTKFSVGRPDYPWVFSPSKHEISMKLWRVCESVNQQFKHRCFCFCATELSFGKSGGRGGVVEKSGWVSIINDAERGNKVDSLLSSSS